MRLGKDNSSRHGFLEVTYLHNEVESNLWTEDLETKRPKWRQKTTLSTVKIMKKRRRRSACTGEEKETVSVYMMISVYKTSASNLKNTSQ